MLQNWDYDWCLSVLSHQLIDCGYSSACVAYKNGQIVQTPINTAHITAIVQKQWRASVEDWRQFALRTPCENFLATPLYAWRGNGNYS